ncbi:uncharacterized protein L3040_007889 [Drepanopeziza brunnea f. sp. 'multigermtubi']|uniref:uncharacterized protein n=1 Tax=Drepanopeziza brunnea f. sp. 'multigermtubi' TaxID=698441 RepID=UPI00239EC63B|nr:hypothetical protein L3040_007889 [Drepanopeziza brunnea f. sp. 'multigermtubi']
MSYPQGHISNTKSVKYSCEGRIQGKHKRRDLGKIGMVAIHYWAPGSLDCSFLERIETIGQNPCELSVIFRRR